MEIEEDRLRLAADLINALDRRVQPILHDRCLLTLQVFHASALVALHCGACEDGILQMAVPDGEYKTYGVEECRKVLAVISKMPHIIKSGMDFDPRLAFRFMEKIKKSCQDWYLGISARAAVLQIVSFQQRYLQRCNTIIMCSSRYSAGERRA